ncbi:MAG: hypothetical protein JXA41_14895 [Deltaproteobacteria bacterium]|nr:hypothetical protein [Deltaproteobacteria bacterium]
MITVLLVTDCGEVVILHYDTDSEDEAARRLGSDWAQGKITFASLQDPELFGPEWAEDSIEEAINDMIPQYENGVRFIHFYCTGGPHEGDDRQAWAYFIHSTHGRQPVGVFGHA